MGTSSARPDDLERFATRSRGADDALRGHDRRLRSVYNSFLDGTEWGVLDIHSLLAGFGTYVDYNEIDAQWVARIAQAFRRAGGNGSVRTLPDAAIQASLRAAGLLGGRASVTFDDPVAYGFPPTTGYANDPVNTASGNFVELENDLPFAGLTAGLRFARMYNSRSDHTGAFGPGWSSWADARLQPRADGAEYVGPDGQRALFPRSGEGYGRVLGVAGRVEPGASGLVLRWFGGERWEFDEAGRPARLTRGPGTDVHVTHEDGRLFELRHAGGKTVRVHWDDERIAALECSDGRSATYRYDAGELVEADGAAGARHYEVGDAGRVLSVTDADGVVEVANAYDEDGRVLRQLSPFGRNTMFGYLPGQVTVTSDENDGPTNVYLHDTAGRLLQVIAGDETRVSFAYDGFGNPVAVTDRKGAVTVQEWDERSNLKRRILPTGVEFAFTHDDADRVLDVTASTGACFRHAYEGAERSPVELIDAEGGVTRLSVDGGLVHAIADPDGVRLEFEFDDDGNLVGARDADGNVARLERDAAGLVTASISPLGRRTTFAHDSHGRVLERREPGGAVWRYEYSPAGRLTAVVDPAGAREEIRYGEHGEAAASVDPLGHVTTHAYDVFGNRTEVAAGDATWRFAYDALCRLTRIADPTGATWQREYDANGNLTASVDPAGTRYQAAFDDANRVTALYDGLTSASFDYDALGRCLAQQRPDGTLARAEYDRLGRRTSIADPAGGTSAIEYTLGGRVQRLTEPSGATTVFEYDRCGRPAARMDGVGRRWEFRYDADGALVESIAPGGETERLAYDDAGRLVEWEAPGHGRTTYTYDERGLVVAISDRQYGKRRFAYDTAGRLVAATDANGATTHFEYDEHGRPTAIHDPLGGTVARTYDLAGRLVREVDQLGRARTWTYDAAGRLVAQVDGAGRRREWSYDESGRVRAFGAAGEAPVTITRDALGRGIAIDEPDGYTHALSWDRAGRLVERRRDDLALRYGYDEDGRRAFVAYPDGTRTEYRYDASGLLAGLSHAATGAIEFDRDASGRIVRALGAGLNARWDYAGGELVGYALDGATTTLARDAAGRLVAVGDQRLAYDAAGQLVAAGDQTFEYDVGGRLVREGSLSYEYDAAGQLVARGNTIFEYDGSGRRVRESGDGLDRAYRWDALGRLVEVGDTRVAVDALGELAEVDGAPLLWDTADPLSPPAWVDDRAVVGGWATAHDGGAEWLAPDWQGTLGGPRDAFGAPAAPQLRLGYRGELEFAGLTWLRARAYDPSTRGFLSPDPLPPVQGTAYAGNTYHYAGNDPLGRVDPLGQRPVTDQELREIRDRMGQDFFSRNADYIVAGVLIVGGIAVMATGVGGPLGAAMIGGALLSAGASAGIQKVTTGSVDYGEVAVAGLIGAGAGGLGFAAGAAVTGTSTAAAVGRGALAGGVESFAGGAANRGFHGGNPFDPGGMATDLLLGGGIGGVGGRLGAGRATATELPTVEFPQSRVPNIARNISEAQAEGHPAVLNRVTDPAIIDANRAAACRGFCGTGSPDEYPFASTTQGGADARVVGVPLREQRIQGGILSRFYQDHGVGDGDPFRVEVVP